MNRLNYIQLYTNTVNPQMELARGQTIIFIYLINLQFLQDWFPSLVIKFLNFIILGRSIRCFGSSEVRFSLKFVYSNM